MCVCVCVCVSSNLGSILLLKLVKVSPAIPEVWVNLYSTLEPFATFTDLSLGPKQPVDHKRGREEGRREEEKERHREKRERKMIKKIEPQHQ